MGHVVTILKTDKDKYLIIQNIDEVDIESFLKEIFSDIDERQRQAREVLEKELRKELKNKGVIKKISDDLKKVIIKGRHNVPVDFNYIKDYSRDNTVISFEMP